MTTIIIIINLLSAENVVTGDTPRNILLGFNSLQTTFFTTHPHSQRNVKTILNTNKEFRVNKLTGHIKTFCTGLFFLVWTSIGIVHKTSDFLQTDVAKVWSEGKYVANIWQIFGKSLWNICPGKYWEFLGRPPVLEVAYGAHCSIYTVLAIFSLQDPIANVPCLQFDFILIVYAYCEICK